MIFDGNQYTTTSVFAIYNIFIHSQVWNQSAMFHKLLRALNRQVLCSQSEVDACGDSLMTALWELFDMEDAQGAISAELGGFRCSTASGECRDS